MQGYVKGIVNDHLALIGNAVAKCYVVAQLLFAGLMFGILLDGYKGKGCSSLFIACQCLLSTIILCTIIAWRTRLHLAKSIFPLLCFIVWSVNCVLSGFAFFEPDHMPNRGLPRDSCEFEKSRSP